MHKAGVEFQHVIHDLCHALINALSTAKWSHARVHHTPIGLLNLIFVFFLRIMILNGCLSYNQENSRLGYPEKNIYFFISNLRNPLLLFYIYYRSGNIICFFHDTELGSLKAGNPWPLSINRKRLQWP